jgi:hypothetical protein
MRHGKRFIGQSTDRMREMIAVQLFDEKPEIRL